MFNDFSEIKENVASLSRKQTENIFIYYILHSVFFHVFGSSIGTIRYLAGTLRVGLVSRSSGRLAHKRTNKRLHSRACSTRILNGAIEDVFLKGRSPRFPLLFSVLLNVIEAKGEDLHDYLKKDFRTISLFIFCVHKSKKYQK